ncbi:hypothetical protein L596_005502 [Steinernema carpocapsae]|uniref:Fibronectin type-III domain-containing protein n=1 Tax=Steinernema carpocapsae TaxID=34508 RepID=A0A4V6YSY9_STECR|nr:hypothetical protein L596_005502 [Steinernema carpocapsae]
MEANETVQFKCEVRSDPRLKIDYQWRHNGVVLNESITMDEGVSILTLKKARGRNSGIIDCAAITDVDVHVSGFVDVPEAPDVYAAECDQRRAMLLWRNPSAYGDPVTHFDVQMETAFAPDEWHPIVKETETGKESFQADTPWCVFTELIDLSVSLSVNTRSRHRLQFPRTSQPATSWTPSAQPSLRSYKSGRRPSLGDGSDKFGHLLDADGQDRLERSSVELPCAIQAEQRRRELARVSGRGPSGVPTDAPQNFRLEAYHNFSSALLNWDAVNRSSLRGHFEGYRVDYWLTQEPYNVETLYTDHNVTSIILSRLGAVTNYSARVYAMNTKHSSPPSEELQFFTPEGAPSKVHNLRVRAVGSTSLLLTWAPPLQPNGQIRGFFVSFENATGDIEETYVLHRQLYYLYEEATPDSAYKVSGEGPKTSSYSPDTIDVEWLPSNKSTWGMPGSSFYVNFTREGMDQWIQTESVTLPTTEITLRGLDEDSTYLLTGVARDGQRSRSSEVVIVHTQGVTTSIDVKNFRSAVWFFAVLTSVFVAATTILVMCCCCRDRKKGEYAVKRRELERGHHYDDEHRAFIEYQYGTEPKK